VIISDNRFTGHDPANAAGINFGHPDPDLNLVITNNELINDSSIALANTSNVKIAEPSSARRLARFFWAAWWNWKSPSAKRSRWKPK
jgi:hypothetical protein